MNFSLMFTLRLESENWKCPYNRNKKNLVNSEDCVQNEDENIAIYAFSSVTVIGKLQIFVFHVDGENRKSSKDECTPNPEQNARDIVDSDWSLDQLSSVWASDFSCPKESNSRDDSGHQQQNLDYPDKVVTTLTVS